MNKTKSIVVLSIVAVFIILMTVFGVIDTFPIGNSLYDYTGYVRTINLGLDMSGGVSAVFEVQPDGTNNDDLDARVDGTMSSIQSLLVSKGYTEATVSKGTNSNGKTTLRVEVPDVEDPERVLRLIGRPASLEFKGEKDADEALIIGSKHLDNAYVTMDDSSNYAVGLKFNAAGTEKFAQVTGEYTGKPLYIYIDGALYTQVNVQTQISNGSAIITHGGGGYTYQEALDFATRLQSGTFGVKLVISEVKNISATLGENSIRTALIAGAVGIAIIFIFLAIIYRGMGLAADLALCVYIVLLLWFCAVLPWVQLTLPGIAGILLSIGMAVDANVIIFERVKDEARHSGKGVINCIKDGFKRSTAAIIDGNVTTLIGAIVLWILGSASIVGFAVTLFIGIILSMFTSLVISRLVLKCFTALNKHDGFYALKRESVEEESESSEVSVTPAVEEA